MIVQGIGLDCTGRHTIGVVPVRSGFFTGWRVAIDCEPVGPVLATQGHAELVALWLREVGLPGLKIGGES